jgi:hypothetical protein
MRNEAKTRKNLSLPDGFREGLDSFKVISILESSDQVSQPFLENSYPWTWLHFSPHPLGES